MLGMWKIAENFFTKEEEGATVVEMAVIVPMICIFIMGFILFFFFLLDMGIVTSESMRSSNRCAREIRLDDKKGLDAEKKDLEQRLNRRLVIAKIRKININRNLDSITSKVEVGFFLAKKGLTFSNSAKVSINHREEWLRLMAH